MSIFGSQSYNFDTMTNLSVWIVQFIYIFTLVRKNLNKLKQKSNKIDF